jgi:hypothetical protein
MNQSTEKVMSLNHVTAAGEHNSPNFTKCAQEILGKIKKPILFQDFIINCLSTLSYNIKDLKRSEIEDTLLTLLIILQTIVGPLQEAPDNSTAIIAEALEDACKMFGTEKFKDQIKKILTMSLEQEYNYFTVKTKKQVDIFETLLKIA